MIIRMGLEKRLGLSFGLVLLTVSIAEFVSIRGQLVARQSADALAAS